MKVLVLLFLAAMHTACVAAEEGSGNNSALVIEDAVGDGAEAAQRAKVDLHCFFCTSLTNKKCGDPFESGVPVSVYTGKSVCFKFKRDDVVWRGGILESEYLLEYENGGLDQYPSRSLCSALLCNEAPRTGSLPPLLLLLVTTLFATTSWQ